jgi:hypothetical protein
VQRPLTSRPRGWPAGQTPCSAGPTLKPLAVGLHGHALKEAIIRSPKLEVGLGGRPAMWLGWPTPGMLPT